MKSVFRGTCWGRRVWRLAGLLVALAVPASVARAHAGEPLAPHDLWSAWNLDPPLLLGLGLCAWFYGRGVANLWGRAGRGRGISHWQVLSFAASLLVLFVALVSPLDPLGEALFSAHMVQHLLLILVAAPLLVFGAPPVAFAWGFPSGWRPKLGRWWHRREQLRGWVEHLGKLLTGPLLVWVLHVAALWFWHLPSFFQAAIQNQGIHILEHLSFFGTALLFWWVILRRDRLNSGAAAFYLFTMALQSGVLGALITFSSSPWYTAYEASAPAWGLVALDDQQLAGVIMWVPGNAVYLAALLWILGDWFHRMERRDAQFDSQAPVPELDLQEESSPHPVDQLSPVEGGLFRHDK